MVLFKRWKMRNVTLPKAVIVFRSEPSGDDCRLVLTNLEVRAGAKLQVSEPSLMTIVMRGGSCDKAVVSFVEVGRTHYLLVEEMGVLELIASTTT